MYQNVLTCTAVALQEMDTAEEVAPAQEPVLAHPLETGPLAAVQPVLTASQEAAEETGQSAENMEQAVEDAVEKPDEATESAHAEAPGAAPMEDEDEDDDEDR